jgi:leader peptidase (prepilin peptidase)/N-methyltransferase
MAAMGTIIGWDRVLLSDLFAFFIAALFGIILILCKKADRKSYIPFAPFLSVGVFIAALLPNNIVDFFMSNII